MAVLTIKPVRRPRSAAKPVSRDAPLRFLLIDEPGPRRDGRRLQLELDGYQVVTAWEAEPASVELHRADIAEVVLSDSEHVRRLATLLASPDFPAALLVRSAMSRAALAARGFSLRPQDHVVVTSDPGQA